jgi:hypothetical protein
VIYMSDFVIYSTEVFDQTRVNSTIEAGGRFGNVFLRNMIASRIAQMNHLRFIYDRQDEMNQLGISYYTDGTSIYGNTLLINDDIIDRIAFDDEAYRRYLSGNNIFFKMHDYDPFHQRDHAWCQTSKIARFVKDQVDSQRERVITSNPWTDRYNNNNSVYVHVRLGDTVSLGFSIDFDYYDRALSWISFEKGYISSDSIGHDTCQRLIQKYGLEEFHESEVRTVQFASTCKHMVLSSGTFSWLLGVFGFFSDVYYPKIKVKWHGDIFIFPEWREVDY